ncbi:MAG: DUF1127 domain-containing protein [Alphaproteobacteria bacterium]|nr:DUF1127 domain-containing protein [Alphaproteobacteria bacterium]
MQISRALAECFRILNAASNASLVTMRRFEKWMEVRRQRRQLLTLDRHALKDIGISRSDAEREAARPFWDVADRQDVASDEAANSCSNCNCPNADPHPHGSCLSR